MTSYFHRNLNRMALFTALVVAVLILFFQEFLLIAIANIYLNGIIIGAGAFGIGLCFVDMFKLLPEYKWMKNYLRDGKKGPLPPRLLRPVAVILHAQASKSASLSPSTLQGLLDMILGRFEDQRESVRYITNTLIFLGLLGTFWGLILTVGGFAELIRTLDFNDENIMAAMQQGLSAPLSGMATAFTSSLLGLAGSLIVGFLGLQVQLAQNGIFRELEEKLSERATVCDAYATQALPQIGIATQELTQAVRKLEQTVSQLT